MTTLKRLVRGSLALACALAQLACTGPEELAAAMGYSALTPPGRAYQPGAILWLREKSQAYQADSGVICSATAALGPHARVQTYDLPLAATEMSVYVAKLSKRAMAAMRKHHAFNAIAHVTIELTDLAILSVTPDVVASHAEARDPACVKAVLARRAQGFSVTMVQRALSVRAHYRFAFTRQAPRDPVRRRRLLEQVAPMLNLSAADVTSARDIIGHSVVWGIIDDAGLLGLNERSYAEPAQVWRHIPVRVADKPLSTTRAHPDVR